MQYRCSNNLCILTSYVCDRIYDCSDHSDELNCGNSTSGGCLELYYHCRSGVCIPRDHQCDGQAHCNDGSDELNCPVLQRHRGIVLDVTNRERFILKVCAHNIFIYCLYCILSFKDNN